MELIPASEIRKMRDEALPKAVGRHIKLLNKELRRAVREGSSQVYFDVDKRLVRDQVIAIIIQAGYRVEPDLRSTELLIYL
jgi:hypothetical protein